MHIKHIEIGVKQAWSIKNYRYVCNVSASPSLTPARPEQVSDKQDNFWGDMLFTQSKHRKTPLKFKG